MIHAFYDLIHHHSLRDIKFSELTELYTSMMIKTLGLSLIGIFVPIYLYNLGFSIPDISLFYVAYFIVKSIFHIIASELSSYFGPKHVMIYSNILMVTSLALLALLPHFDISVYWIAITNATANALFITAYHIEFSKIQSVKHGGSEIGKMFQIAKITGVLGPLVGGILAQLYGFNLVVIISTLLVAISVIPLIMSPEPTERRKHATLRSFPWKKVQRNYWINAGLSFDQLVVLFTWPLFVAIFIFTDNVYINLGVITTVGLIASLLTARLFGKMLDDGRVKKLFLRGSTYSAVIHILRVAAQTTPVAYILNTANEISTLALRMSHTKIIYKQASSLSAYRHIYIGMFLALASIINALTWLTLYFVATEFSDKTALQISFILGAALLYGTRYIKVR